MKNIKISVLFYAMTDAQDNVDEWKITLYVERQLNPIPKSQIILVQIFDKKAR